MLLCSGSSLGKSLRMRVSKGYIVMLMAIVMVVAGGFIVTITMTWTTTARSSVDRQLSKQAYQIAEAGLERAKFALWSPHTSSPDNLTKRYQCTDIDFSNVSYGEGEFTATGTEHDTSTTLSAGINSSASIIPVASLTGLSSEGKVTIGSETIDYVGTSTSSSVCGTQPCLLNAIRGVDSTSASSHSSGASVSQTACLLEVVAGVPTISGAIGKRTIRQLVNKPGSGDGKIWVVGDDSGSDEIIFSSDDGSSWTQFPPSGSISGDDLFGLHMVDANFGVAVGDNDAGRPQILHYNGTSWVQVSSSSLPNEELYAVYCVSNTDCWAVGDNYQSGGGSDDDDDDDGGSSGAFIARWNGVSWSHHVPHWSIPSEELYDVFCLASNDCFAVGDNQGGSGLVIRWNGSSWSRMSFIDNRDVRAIYCISTNDCWAGGASGKMYHYDGTWTDDIDDIGSTVLDIVCSSSSDCKAVGASRSIQHYNGSNWSSVSGVSSLPNRDYWGVDCISSDECYAVGDDDSNDPLIVTWNGSSWSRISLPSLPNRDLNDIHVGQGGGGESEMKTAPLVEDFH